MFIYIFVFIFIIFLILSFLSNYFLSKRAYEDDMKYAYLYREKESNLAKSSNLDLIEPSEETFSQPSVSVVESESTLNVDTNIETDDDDDSDTLIDNYFKQKNKQS